MILPDSLPVTSEKPFRDPALRETGEFLKWEELNPFARIACKTRTLTPTLCDGTCGNCKRERDTYRTEWVRHARELDVGNPERWAGIEEYPIPDDKYYETYVASKIQAFANLKARVIEARSHLFRSTEQRVARLIELSREPSTYER